MAATVDSSGDLLPFLHDLPKVELHAHINGSVNEATIDKLINLRKGSFKESISVVDWTVAKGIIKKGQRRTLSQCFEIFGLIHHLCDNDEAAYIATKDVIDEFAAEKVKYVELRTTPRSEGSKGMTKESHIKAVIKAIEDHKQAGTDIDVRLLLSVDRKRSLDDAYDTVRIAKQYLSYSSHIVLGVDFSGDPKAAHGSDFLPIFQEAKNSGLKTALHLAEIAGQNEETKCLLTLPPDRIGHGTHLHVDMGGTQDFIDTVTQHKIPIEACITSNVCLQTVKAASDHQFGFWYHRGHPCIICTDDKGVFDTTLCEEYLIAAQAFSLDRQQLYELSYSAIDAAFVPEHRKQELRDMWTHWHSQNRAYFECT